MGILTYNVTKHLWLADNTQPSVAGQFYDRMTQDPILSGVIVALSTVGLIKPAVQKLLAKLRKKDKTPPEEEMD